MAAKTAYSLVADTANEATELTDIISELQALMVISASLRSRTFSRRAKQLGFSVQIHCPVRRVLLQLWTYRMWIVLSHLCVVGQQIVLRITMEGAAIPPHDSVMRCWCKDCFSNWTTSHCIFDTCGKKIICCWYLKHFIQYRVWDTPPQAFMKPIL